MDFLPPVIGRLVGDSSDYSAKVRAAKGDADELERKSRGAGAAGNTAMASIGDGASRAHGGVSALHGVIGALGTAAAVVGSIQVLGGFLREAGEAQKVGAQTAAVIASTGGAAHVTAAQVDSLANAISRKTGIDDEQIATTSNMLLTFTNVRNEVGAGNDIFNQATQTATDMATALGEDGSAAAMQLGKALNDPIQGVTALRRVGVQLNDQQEAQVKAMVASGDQMGAQKVILAELTKEFGGSAEAQATSADKIKVAWNNIQEAAGTALLPVVDAILPAFQGALDALAPALGPIGQLVANIVTAIAPAIPPLIPIVVALAEVFGKVLLALEPIVPPVLGLVTALGPIVPIVGNLVASLVSGLVPVLAAVISALVPVVNVILTALQPVMKQVQPIIGQLAGAFLQVVMALLPLLPPIAQLIVALLPLVPVILQINLAWLQLLPVIMPIVEVLVQFAALLVGGLAEGITFAIGLFSDFDGTLQGIESAAAGVWQFFSDLPGKILGLVGSAAGWLVDVGRKIIGGLLDGIVAYETFVFTTILDIAPRILAIVAGAGAWLWNTGVSIIAGLVNGLGSAVGGLLSWLGGLPGEIINAVGDGVGWLVGVGINAIHGILDGAGQAFGDLWNWLSGLPGRVWDAVGNIFDAVSGIGENIVIGIWNGIAGMGSWLWDKITGFAHDMIPGPIRAVLNIFSPSRVMAGLGINIAQGLAEGIIGGTDQVASAAIGMANAVHSAVAGPGPAIAATGSATFTSSHITDFALRGSSAGGVLGAARGTVVNMGGVSVHIDGSKDPEATAYAVRDILLRDEAGGRTPNLWGS